MSGGENQRTPRLMIRAEQLRTCHFCSAFSRALESPLQAGSSPFTGLRIELESIDINRYQSISIVSIGSSSKSYPTSANGMCTEQKLKPPTNGRNNKSVPKLFAKQKSFLFKNSKSIQKIIPQNLLNMAGAGFGMSLVGGLTERTGSGQTATDL